MVHHTMDDNTQNILGNSTKDALIKLRNDIRTVVNEHKKKKATGYFLYYTIFLFNKFKYVVENI